MSKTLFITTSMTLKTNRGSISTFAMEIFKKKYIEKNPYEEIIELNLNDLDIASITLTSNNMVSFFDAKYCDPSINQLKQVDKIVMAVPMTNFNYPAVVKNYLDHVLVAKKTFIYKYDGKGTSEGLLKHLKVQLITSQGATLGWYPFGDHTRTLKGTWEFMGAQVTSPIIVDGTKSPAKLNLTKEELIQKFIPILEKAANSF